MPQSLHGQRGKKPFDPNEWLQIFCTRGGCENRPYLRHGQRSSLGEGVVVEVEDAELRVVAHGRSQRHHTCVVDPILGHVDFFQAAYQLT